MIREAIGVVLLVIGVPIALVLLAVFVLRELLIRHIESHGKDGF